MNSSKTKKSSTSSSAVVDERQLPHDRSQSRQAHMSSMRSSSRRSKSRSYERHDCGDRDRDSSRDHRESAILHMNGIGNIDRRGEGSIHIPGSEYKEVDDGVADDGDDMKNKHGNNNNQHSGGDRSRTNTTCIINGSRDHEKGGNDHKDESLERKRRRNRHRNNRK